MMNTTRRSHPYDIWEYKIVRARNAEFGQRRHLNALLQQESLAGWEIVEKYNDSQVRFKRPRSARNWDRSLPPYVDPYRTVYTVSYSDHTLHMIYLTLGVLFAIIFIAVLGILASLPG